MGITAKGGAVGSRRESLSDCGVEGGYGMNGEGDGARLLEDVRVVEMGSVLAGSLCGQLLGGSTRLSGPKPGEHNDEIYGELLKLDERERDALRERGTV